MTPWDSEKAKYYSSTAKQCLRHSYDHGSKPDPDNCSGCALRTGDEEGPNYAGWARIYVESGMPVPDKWQAAFERERQSKNELYRQALERSILTFGMPRFLVEEVI